jgi:hypothetical protein
MLAALVRRIAGEQHEVIEYLKAENLWQGPHRATRSSATRARPGAAARSAIDRPAMLSARLTKATPVAARLLPTAVRKSAKSA